MELTKEQKYIKEKYEKLMMSGCDDQYMHAKDIYKTFPELFKRELPKSWEEFCEIKNIDSSAAFNYSLQTRFVDHSLKKDYKFFWGNYDLLPDKYVALRKLELLALDYNDNIKCKEGHRISPNNEGDLYIYWSKGDYILQFKTVELADEFLNNFKDLIKQAEDLV
jgi:hypothetical protein